MLLDLYTALIGWFSDSASVNPVEPVAVFHPGEIVFLLLCFAGAWMVGKSIATDWKSITNLVIAILLLGCGARFLHFALYEAHFLSLERYLVDTAVLMVIGFLGYRYKRTNQMTSQYHWLYEKASPFSWKDRG